MFWAGGNFSSKVCIYSNYRICRYLQIIYYHFWCYEKVFLFLILSKHEEMKIILFKNIVKWHDNKSIGYHASNGWTSFNGYIDVKSINR